MLPSPAQVRAARAGLDWTQRQLAAAARIHPRTVKMIERGKVRPMRATAQGLAKAFATAGVSFMGTTGVILPPPVAIAPAPKPAPGPVRPVAPLISRQVIPAPASANLSAWEK